MKAVSIMIYSSLDPNCFPVPPNSYSPKSSPPLSSRKGEAARQIVQNSIAPFNYPCQVTARLAAVFLNLRPFGWSFIVLNNPLRHWRRISEPWGKGEICLERFERVHLDRWFKVMWNKELIYIIWLKQSRVVMLLWRDKQVWGFCNWGFCSKALKNFRSFDIWKRRIVAKLSKQFLILLYYRRTFLRTIWRITVFSRSIF